MPQSFFLAHRGLLHRRFLAHRGLPIDSAPSKAADPGAPATSGLTAVSCRAAVAFSQHAFAVSWHTAAVVHEPIDSAPSKAADPGAPATSVAQ
ncbi:hypothetical protein HPB50_001172 [Hyalomma asiaticum]|uniref:Uncharacterized protein n=1 Tax=Hyalomma asiaticum TaxID=266040 RepID=A0ACB7RR27_HYAAI|nr:hypothetical protein HPB50_001172 [Hyalomma asiaticum]